MAHGAAEFIGTVFRRLSPLEQSLGPFVLRAALITSIPVVGLNAWIQLMGDSHMGLVDIVRPWPIPTHPRVAFTVGLLDILIFSPFVETALMLVPIRLLKAGGVRDPWILVISGLIWAAIHTRGESWIQVIQFWPFFCFTKIQIECGHQSADRAWLVTSAVHGVHNLYGLIAGYVLVLVA